MARRTDGAMPKRILIAGALLALADHLTPAEALGVLLERRQLRQGVITHQ